DVCLVNATVAYNQAVGGTGAGGVAPAQGGGIEGDSSVTLINTIVALNTAGGSPSDVSGSVGLAVLPVSSGNNLIGVGGSGGVVGGRRNNQVGVANPGLTPLLPGGGPNGIPTVALLPSSPALDAG